MTIFSEALIDTGRLLPLLAAIYFLIAFLEYKYEDRMGHFIMRFGVWGPIAGALFGCLPQCGFSVIVAALYVKRLASVGTLLAVFISTSDEAVPVLLTMPGNASVVGLLILTKVIIAITAGIAVDFFVNRGRSKKKEGHSGTHSNYEMAVDEHKGCCSHDLTEKPSKLKTLFWHPLTHTVKIYIFLFILAVLQGIIFSGIGEDRIKTFLLNGTIFQPIIASFIGLIPSCFTSVLMAGLYAKSIISFGSLVSGLSAGSGLGVLVLVKENSNFKDTLRIIGLLLLISISAGILIQTFNLIR